MPKFNSNDTKIVYSSGNGEHFNIFTMDFDGEINKRILPVKTITYRVGIN